VSLKKHPAQQCQFLVAQLTELVFSQVSVATRRTLCAVVADAAHITSRRAPAPAAAIPLPGSVHVSYKLACFIVNLCSLASAALADAKQLVAVRQQQLRLASRTWQMRSLVKDDSCKLPTRFRFAVNCLPGKEDSQWLCCSN